MATVLAQSPPADMNHFLNGSKIDPNSLSAMEKMTARHFWEHGKPNANPREKENCHLCQIRSFATHKAIPITIHNETGDGAVLNPNFRFIDKSVVTPAVPVAEASFRAGCVCPEDDDCMYSDCHCLDEIELSDSEQDAEDTLMHNFSNPTTHPARMGLAHQDREARRKRKRRKVFAYHSSGARAGLLKSDMLHSRDAIYECHEGCSCTADCPNRVVERGRTVPLEIFRTADRGWGVRCPVDIKKGQFVDRYLGEVITSQEADLRRNESSIARRKDVYLFALDKFTDPNSPNELLRGPPIEVDGEYMSGPTRFINHSCDPNMRIFARVGDHADKHIHDLALFAVRDIPKGDELTFDYVDGLEEMDKDAHDPNRVKDMTECLCGTAKCRGFLW